MYSVISRELQTGAIKKASSKKMERSEGKQGGTTTCENSTRQSKTPDRPLSAKLNSFLVFEVPHYQHKPGNSVEVKGMSKSKDFEYLLLFKH
jgi:hypothetical protein